MRSACELGCRVGMSRMDSLGRFRWAEGWDGIPGVLCCCELGVRNCGAAAQRLSGLCVSGVRIMDVRSYQIPWWHCQRAATRRMAGHSEPWVGLLCLAVADGAQRHRTPPSPPRRQETVRRHQGRTAGIYGQVPRPNDMRSSNHDDPVGIHCRPRLSCGSLPIPPAVRDPHQRTPLRAYM